ncbi:MAG: lipoate--protein ligase [Spirochaetales bacterium]|nr:MAG: lipoate--protein ligase [Spirochaetales bacterium]
MAFTHLTTMAWWLNCGWIRRADTVPLVLFEGHDPFLNHAIEETILDTAGTRGPTLAFWRNAPCVVIGRHQNPWIECDLPRMRQDGVHLLRRVSGGGTVFHDLGNTNFAFIAATGDYDQQRQFSVIIRGLALLGINATLSPRNDLLVEGRKISGNAFRHTRGNSLHHGTLLVTADLGSLGAYLTPPSTDIQTRSIPSVRSSVVTLSLGSPGISHEQVCDAIARVFCDEYGQDREDLLPASLDHQAVWRRRAVLTSWEWQYGMTPLFSRKLGGIPGVGATELRVRHGIITEMEPGPAALRLAIAGQRYNSSDLVALAETRDPNTGAALRSIAKELNEWTTNPLEKPGSP